MIQENPTIETENATSERFGRMFFKIKNGKVSYVSQFPYCKNMDAEPCAETEGPEGRITFVINGKPEKYHLPLKVLEAIAGKEGEQKRAFLSSEEIILTLGDVTKLPVQNRPMIKNYNKLLERVAADENSIAMVSYR
jgi:hypothetical protein